MRITVSSRRRTAFLYIGVAVFVALSIFTARSIWLAWQQRSGDAKAAAIFDLVQQRMPPRPTEAPGAMAWLKLELDRYRQQIVDPERARLYAAFAGASRHVPEELRSVADALRGAVTASASTEPIDFVASDNSSADSIRRERLVSYGGRTFVVTRRRDLDENAEVGPVSHGFVASVVRVLGAATEGVARKTATEPLPALPGRSAPHPVRLYAVAEDGTLVSAPWIEPGVDQVTAATRERLLLAARPTLPAFAPQEFFFQFDRSSVSGDAWYSGFYLDLGGRGLVSTVTTPLAMSGLPYAVLALDLAFDIDWQRFAATVSAPVIGAATVLRDGTRGSWTELAAALDEKAPAPLRTAVRAVADGDQQSSNAAATPAPLRHAVVESAGAVAAFQVSDRTWLLMLFPKSSPSFPVVAVALLAGVLALLFAGFEINRRRADDERFKAERALAEKQNLLNTMQVPLVVVDPNTDVIVSSNRAASSIGIRAGSRFEDLVAPDPRARAHYEKMQVASPEPRRAYGMPVQVIDDRGERSDRYALVRSVAVTAPIEALAADERHRLGVLFLLEPDADLALLAADIEARAHRDARRRLAGLLSHGVETFARVLEHCLTRPVQRAGSAEFTAWLAEYLERRLTVTAWLLDHWDAPPSLPHEVIVDANHARATVARLESVFALVRDDLELRTRLHWENGVLAADPGGPILDVAIDWPDTFQFTCPVRGGFGFFVSEVLANAIRHGRPGSTPVVRIACDRVRRELICHVENTTNAASATIRGEAYGGVEILKVLARLFEWESLTFDSQSGTFVVSWRIPVSERGAAGQAD